MTSAKVPVGKFDSEDTRTNDYMHVLVWHEEAGEWRLRCHTGRKGHYNYMGFKVAITCSRCRNAVK